MRLSICTIVNSSSVSALKEWVAFHYLVGFRKFYIFVAGGDVNSINIVEKLKVHIDISGFSINENAKLTEGQIYTFAYEKFGKSCDWMAFLRLNEFLFSPITVHIAESFAFFMNKALGAIAVHKAAFSPEVVSSIGSTNITSGYRSKFVDSGSASNEFVSVLRGGLDFIPVFGEATRLFTMPLGTFDENLVPITASSHLYSKIFFRLRVNAYPIFDTVFPCAGDPNIADALAPATFTRHSVVHSTHEDHSLQHLVPRLEELYKILL